MPKKQRSKVSDNCHQLSFDPFAGSGKFDADPVRTIREADINAPTMSRNNSVNQKPDAFRHSFGSRIAKEDTLAAEAANREQELQNAPVMPQPVKPPLRYERSKDRTLIEGDGTFCKCLIVFDLLSFWLWKMAPYILTLVIILNYGLTGLPALIGAGGWEWAKSLRK